MSQGYKTCPKCGQVEPTESQLCLNCGYSFAQTPMNAPQMAPNMMMNAPAEANSKKITTGILAILLGAFGVHKFVLGMTTPAVIMLCITVLTCGFGAFISSIIGIVEGIIYLTKSDAEFYQTYMVEKKGWF